MIEKTVCHECGEVFAQEAGLTLSTTCYICKDKRIIASGHDVSNRLLDNINRKKNNPDDLLI